MTQGDGMAEVTEGDREKAREIRQQYLMLAETPGGLEEAIAAALAEEREKARADILRSLTEDSEWARGIALLGEDVALGIDHARRRVEEMSA